MGQKAAILLLVLAFAVTFALAPGTRTLTDIKGPVFVVGALVLAVLAFWAVILRRVALQPAGGFAAAAAAYLALAAVSALWAPHPWIVKYVFADRFLAVILTVAVALLISDVGAWRTAAVGYVVLGGATAACALYWHGLAPLFAAFGKAPYDQLAQRVSSSLNDIRAPLGNANLLAALLLVSIFLAVGLAVREWKGKRRVEVASGLALFAFLVLPVLFYCKAFSYYIAICAAAVVLVALQSRKPQAIIAAAVLAGMALAALGWQTGLFSRFMETKSYLVRAELWRRGFLMVSERPLLGWGAGIYFTDNQPFAGEKALEKVRYYEGGSLKEEEIYKVPAGADAYCHNEYLQETVEGGAVGLAVYLALLGAAVAASFAARKRGFAEIELLDGAIAAFAGLLVANFFNPEIHFADFEPHFWILAGLLVASRNAVSPKPVPSAAGPVAAVVGCLVVAAASYGVYTFAVEDYRSSLEFQRAADLGSGRNGAADLQAAAEEYLDSAKLTWDPMLRVRALYPAAFCYKYLKNIDSAYNVFSTLSSEFAALLKTDYETGLLLEEAGLYEKALFCYRRHKAGHPEDEDVNARIKLTEALFDLQSGRIEKGLAEGRDYFVDFPDDRVGRRTFVRKMISPEVKYNVETGIQADELVSEGADAEDLALAGIIRYLKGDIKEALPLLEKAMAGGYKGRDGFYYLASSYIDLGRLDDARKVVSKGRQVHPQCRGLAHLASVLGLADSAAETQPSPEKP